MMSPRTLLVVFAHPDDESFGPGGTLARYAAEGVAVHVICATRGEAGAVTGELAEGYSSLAEQRTAELHCAAEVLGLAGVHFLGYRDSGMAGSPHNAHPQSLVQADPDAVAGQVTALMRKLRPQVVITFDPQGGYGHPDHIAMHHAAVRAFHAAGDATTYQEQLKNGLTPSAPQKLYYTAFSRRLLRWLVRLMPLFGYNPTAFGVNRDINLKAIVAVDTPITTRINVSAYLETKQAAAACHRSEGGPAGPYDRLPRLLARRLLSVETFTRAYPPLNPSEPVEDDLFALV
ncbi:MAG: PIG-L family deacetylase, partial [Anaerolineae bacterium]